jgi:hypothetical protein
VAGSPAPLRVGGKKKKKSSRKPVDEKSRKSRHTSPLVPEAPSALEERLDVLSEPIGNEVAEAVNLGRTSLRDEIIGEMAASLREADSKPALMLTKPGLPASSDPPDEEDPYDLDRLVIVRELSATVIRTLAVAVENGSDVNTACNKYLIDRLKVAQWRKLGEQLLAGQEPTTEHETLCMKFALAMQRASGRYETMLDEGVHSKDGFMRFIQIAKVRHPALYGEQSKDQSGQFAPDEAFA